MAEEKRRNEAQALSRWYQLLSSIITRQRLNNCYGDGALFPQSSIETPIAGSDKRSESAACTQVRVASTECQQANIPEKHEAAPPSVPAENHEHEFILDEAAFGDEGMTRIKHCPCGFSIQFEEL